MSCQLYVVDVELRHSVTCDTADQWRTYHVVANNEFEAINKVMRADRHNHGLPCRVRISPSGCERC